MQVFLIMSDRQYKLIEKYFSEPSTMAQIYTLDSRPYSGRPKVFGSYISFQNFPMPLVLAFILSNFIYFLIFPTI